MLTENVSKQSNQLKSLTQVLNGAGVTKWKEIHIRPQANAFKPGHLYSVTYNGTTRILLCVSNFRSGSNGHFISQRKNTLLSLFQLETLRPPLIKAILRTLYKGPVVNNYYAILSTMRAFKVKDYRSLDINKTSSIIEIDFDRNLLKRK